MFRLAVLFALLLALAVIAVDAFARLSAAGLGCPSWPGCYGKGVEEPPLGDLLGTSPYAGPLGGEALLGLIAALGVTTLALAVGAGWLRERRGPALAWGWATLVPAAALGWLATGGAAVLPLPLATSARFLMGFLVLGGLYRLYLAVGPQRPPRGDTRALAWLSRLALLTLAAEILLGGWVSNHYAGLACPDFPRCLGPWWPEAGYREGFLWWQADGHAGGALPLAARAALHWSHQIGALAAFLVLSALALGVTSNRKVPHLSKPGLVLSGLLLAEISLGIALVLLRLPVALGVAHDLGAALLVLTLLHLHYHLRLPQPVPVAPPPEEAPAAVPAPEVELPPPPPAPARLLDRLKQQLGKTRGGLTGVLTELTLGKKAIDRDLLDDLEARLLMADLGVAATRDIVTHLTDSLERHQLADPAALTDKLRAHLYEILAPVSVPLQIPAETRPFVILVVGVNGVGKTTTIGKLAKRLQDQGHSVMLAAGDTFRAAAVEQLQSWGERNRVPVIAQHTGADAASVIYDALQAAQARGSDVLIADTAGRLHTKSNLMDELAKIKRILGRLDPTAPHEVLLVLDAGTGQNALNQARQFHEAVGLTGIALTKLDGTAKGGVIFALAKQFGLPIRYIGIGEGVDDLQEFDAGQFIDALFAD